MTTVISTTPWKKTGQPTLAHNFAMLTDFYRTTLCVSAVFTVGQCPSVFLSVRMSVTLVHCMQMTEDIVKLLSRPISSIILVFLTSRSPVTTPKELNLENRQKWFMLHVFMSKGVARYKFKRRQTPLISLPFPSFSRVPIPYLSLSSPFPSPFTSLWVSAGSATTHWERCEFSLVGSGRSPSR